MTTEKSFSLYHDFSIYGYKKCRKHSQLKILNSTTLAFSALKRQHPFRSKTKLFQIIITNDKNITNSEFKSHPSSLFKSHTQKNKNIRLKMGGQVELRQESAAFNSLECNNTINFKFNSTSHFTCEQLFGGFSY